jgi:hypothetical protein
LTESGETEQTNSRETAMLSTHDPDDRIVAQAFALGLELAEREERQKKRQRVTMVIALSVMLNIVTICWFLMWRLS